MNYVNLSKEFYKVLYKANELSGGNVVELRHILLGLFITKNLISNIFDINNLTIDYKKNKKKTSKHYLIKFSKESLILFSNLFYKNNNINTIDLFSELVASNNIYIKYFFKYINIKTLNCYQTIIRQSNLYYIQNLFYYIKFKKIILIDRVNETTNILDTLLRRVQNNVVLVGDVGIGRFSVVRKVFNSFINITKNNTQQNFKDFYVFDIIKFYSIVSYDTLNIHKQKLYDWILTNFNIILVLNHLENVYDLDLITSIFNIIFILVKQKKLQIIITTDTTKFYSYLNSNVILNNLYEIFIIKELSRSNIVLILQNFIIQLENFYHIKLISDILNLVIDVSNIIYPNRVFPLKAIEILEIVCSKFMTYRSESVYLTKIYFEQIIATLPNSKIKSIYGQNIIKKNFKFLLQKRIFGQKFIINKINNVLIKVLSGFKIDNKPIGSWLLCGPSGTGKTELAKSIAEVLFGDEQKMIRLDMSEFMEKHAISKLIGSPPGYVGYGNRGLLAEAIDKHPHCLLLFDEIEKAHPDILNIMLQILDNGRLTDSTGKIVNFTNTLIILTSNLGCPKHISEFKKEFSSTLINYKIDNQLIMKSINQYFRPELINRLQDILIFQPLEFKVLLLILNKFINQFYKQLKKQKFPIKLLIHENLKKYLVKLSISPLYGARPLKRIFDELIVEPTINILFKTNLIKSHLLFYTLTVNNNISYNIIPNL